MKLIRSTGPLASVQKYDVLTALAIAGLNGKPGFQRSMLRMVALITARYNWKLDELTVGQRDIAKMWAVDERTVKREMKRLTEYRILIPLRPGVRGRVAAYRLNQSEIHRLSQPHWEDVGPDFVARMDGRTEPAELTQDKIVRVDFRPSVQLSQHGHTAWQRTASRLAEIDPDLHRCWFISLVFEDFLDGYLRLRAPSSFVAKYILTHHMPRLRDAAKMEFEELERIGIIF